MSRWILGVSLPFILAAAEQMSGCAAADLDPMGDTQVPDMVDADAALEFSLLQKSLTLQRDQDMSSNVAPQPHQRLSLFSALEAASMWSGKNATSSANLSSLALLSLASASAMQRTRDIIAWPGACVLSLSFVVTLIFVVVLWAVMLEANQATKFAMRQSGSGPEDPRVALKAEHPSALPKFGFTEPLPQAPPAPPICARLILPHGAAQFRIPLEAVDRLRSGNFPVPILGLSGRAPLLHAWLPLCTKTPRNTGEHTPSQVGHLLQLTTTHTARHPHASIGLLHLGAVAQRAPTEIFGPQNQKYGSMTRTNDKWQVHYHSEGSEQLVMTMRTSTAFLGFSAYAPDGRQLASAARISLNGGPQADTLAISASPGADALLALLCILAVVLSMMEKVPPPSEATMAETSTAAYSLPPGYADAGKPDSQRSMPEPDIQLNPQAGRPTAGAPLWPSARSTPDQPGSAQSLAPSAQSIRSQVQSQQMPFTVPSLPAVDTALPARPGTQIVRNLPIFPPGSHPPQRLGPSRSNPVLHPQP